MGKTKDAKNVNRIVRKMNKSLMKDVFKDRFFARQKKKDLTKDGMEYFLYELIDKVNPNRNLIVGWYNVFDIHNINIEMNNFIVNSDFWSLYRQ